MFTGCLFVCLLARSEILIVMVVERLSGEQTRGKNTSLKFESSVYSSAFFLLREKECDVSMCLSKEKKAPQIVKELLSRVNRNVDLIHSLMRRHSPHAHEFLSLPDEMLGECIRNEFLLFYF